MGKFVLALLFASSLVYALDLGKTPPEVLLQGKNGGKIEGGVWKSSTIKDKIYVLFYVDPDFKDKNQPLVDALHEANLDHSKFGSIAVINLAATWKPNFIIERILKSKQKKYPDTIYVKDRRKVLVKRWGLADDDSDVVVFDKDGSVIYQKNGKLSNSEISELIKLIKSKI